MSKRLTDKERAEVVTDYASGNSKSEIARKFKFSPNAISKILREEKNGQKVSFVIRFKAVLKNYKHIKGILKCK